MAPYLCPSNQYLNIKTASFIAKIQTYMIENIKCNFKKYYEPSLICNSCLLNECNQEHLLDCKKLIGSNELVTYIPTYIDIIVDDHTEEQFYNASLMMENLLKKKKIENIA